jgi:hypothetical protein
MTLSEAAGRLGITGPWAAQYLRRLLLERERLTGARLLIRVGNGERRPTYRVNLGVLRRACPELFSPTDEIARALRDVLTGVRTELVGIRETVEELDARIGIYASARGRR